MVNGVGFAQLFDLFEQAGVFNYILPFLVIFALVYGILVRIKIFKDNMAVNAIIALAVGLLSLQFEMVPVFFSQVFPKLGIGLAVILIALIVLGLFMPQEKWVIYILFGIAVVTLIAVLAGSFEYIPTAGGFFSQYGSLIISSIILIVLVSIVVGLSNKKKETKTFEKIAPAWAKDLFGLKQ